MPALVPAAITITAGRGATLRCDVPAAITITAGPNGSRARRSHNHGRPRRCAIAKHVHDADAHRTQSAWRAALARAAAYSRPRRMTIVHPNICQPAMSVKAEIMRANSYLLSLALSTNSPYFIQFSLQLNNGNRLTETTHPTVHKPCNGIGAKLAHQPTEPVPCKHTRS